MEAFESGLAAARLRVLPDCPYPGGSEARELWLSAVALYRARDARRHSRLRELRIRAAMARGSHSNWEWLQLVQKFGGRCAICGQPSERLHRDHILPISKGGSDCITNIQPTCQRCNSVKGARPQPATRLGQNVLSRARRRSSINSVNVKGRDSIPHLVWRGGRPYIRAWVGGKSYQRVLLSPNTRREAHAVASAINRWIRKLRAAEMLTIEYFDQAVNLCDPTPAES